ncbi:histone [Burkholderia cepacia]|uniref:Histone n=2 Tax=Burkholderia cepacia TaxID=292 RepID=A0A2S8I9M8_BURCE|nr:histone [Burkholderia cepacia]
MAQCNALQREIDEMRTHEISRVVEQVIAVLEAHGVTYTDLIRYGKSAAPVKVKRKVAPKYWNPETGETWAGRGRAPLWIAQEADRSKFLLPADVQASLGLAPSASGLDDAATGQGGDG